MMIQRALLFLVDQEAVLLMTLHLSAPSSTHESVPISPRWCRILVSSRGPLRVYGSGRCYSIGVPRTPGGTDWSISDGETDTRRWWREGGWIEIKARTVAISPANLSRSRLKNDRSSSGFNMFISPERKGCGVGKRSSTLVECGPESRGFPRGCVSTVII